VSIEEPTDRRERKIQTVGRLLARLVVVARIAADQYGQPGADS
jgi:hypothetical protein